MGAALLVPTLVPSDAAAQGRSDHGGRHDNGQRRGWDKNDRRDRDDQDRRDRDQDRDRRDRDRRNRDEDRRRRDIEATRARMARDRARIAQDRDRARWDRDRNDRRGDNRQSQKNQWRNLGIAGGAAGLYGLLSGNRTIAALGLGGGLYSTYRYEQDRKSQNRDARGRYELFNRNSFDHQGHHYERRTKNQGGQRYYYFQRTR